MNTKLFRIFLITLFIYTWIYCCFFFKIPDIVVTKTTNYNEHMQSVKSVLIPYLVGNMGRYAGMIISPIIILVLSISLIPFAKHKFSVASSKEELEWEKK